MSLIRFAIWDERNRGFVKYQRNKIKFSKNINSDMLYLHKTTAKNVLDKLCIEGTIKTFEYKAVDYIKISETPAVPYDGYSVVDSDYDFMLDDTRTTYVDFPFFMKKEATIVPLNPLYHAAYFKSMEKLRGFIKEKNRLLDFVSFEDFKNWASMSGLTDEALKKIKYQFHDENILVACLVLTEITP